MVDPIIMHGLRRKYDYSKNYRYKRDYHLSDKEFIDNHIKYLPRWIKHDICMILSSPVVTAVSALASYYSFKGSNYLFQIDYKWEQMGMGHETYLESYGSLALFCVGLMSGAIALFTPPAAIETAFELHRHLRDLSQFKKMKSDRLEEKLTLEAEKKD